MFNFLFTNSCFSDNIAATKQKNCLLQNKSPGFLSASAGLYLVATICLIGVTCKMMHHQIISAHTLLKEQIKKYQKINIITELQQDLLLPAKIIPIDSPNRIGFKIVRQNQTAIDWQFKPDVQRGIKGSWTKLYRGQIEYKIANHQILLQIIE